MVAWYLAFVVGLLTYSFVENATCPAGEMESGICTNEKVMRVLEGVVVAAIAFSAIAGVGAATAMAPAYKAAVSWVAFGAGALVAGYFAVETKMYIGGAAASLAGLASAAIITRYFSTRQGREPR